MRSVIGSYRSRWYRVLGLAVAGLGCVACGDDDTGGPTALAPDPGEELSGGDTTVFDESREAFARPARNLDAEGRETL